MEIFNLTGNVPKLGPTGPGTSTPSTGSTDSTPRFKFTQDQPGTNVASPPPEPVYDFGFGGSFADMALEQQGFIAAGDTAQQGFVDIGGNTLIPEKWTVGPGGAAQQGLQEFGLVGHPGSGQQQQVQPSFSSFGTQSGQQQQQIKPLHEVKWKPTELNTGSGQAPDWWRPVVPADAKDAQRPDVGFLMMLNSMIPFLSPEDQRRAAAQLYAANADGFSFYKPEKIDIEVPVSGRQAQFSERTGIPVIDEDFFLSSQRARDAISTLNQIREKTVEGNRWQLGPGYTWLQQVLGALEAFGGGGSTSIVTGEQHQQDEGPMTPAELLAQRGALDPLLSQAQSEAIGPIGSIGQMLSQPFFSQGQLVPFSRVAGQTQPGAPNPELF